MTLVLGLVIISVTVIAVLRRVDVRLALLLAAIALGAAAALTQSPVSAGPLLSILQTFLATLSDEKFVVPICSALGFAYVLRVTGCDRHLVNALVLPLARLRFLAIPGAVLVGFLVNVPVLSQTGTAVAVGTVLVPLLRGWRITPITTGAALLLGSSIGGELLNPGAPELRTIVSKVGDAQTQDCVRHIFPLVLVQLGVATTIFWVLCLRRESREQRKLAETGKQPVWEGERPSAGDASPLTPTPLPQGGEGRVLVPLTPTPLGRGQRTEVRGQNRLTPTPMPTGERGNIERVNWLKACIPLVPILLLLVTTPGYGLFEVPASWVLTPKEMASRPLTELPRESRLVGFAMLVGVLAAAFSVPSVIPKVAASFFEGAGYGYTHVISLIVAAQCFGKGIEGLRLDVALESVLGFHARLLLPMAAIIPFAFAWLSGSGMASTASLYGLFLPPTQALGADPLQMGAVMSIASAAGRTSSPVSAVALMSASLTETSVFELTRQVLPPLLVATLVMVLMAMLL